MISNLHFSDNLDKPNFCGKLRKSLSLILFAIIILPSCNITKFLGEDEKLIDEVNVEITSNAKSSVKTDLKEELEKFTNVSPNKSFRSRNYLKFKDKENLSWIKRWLWKKHSEAPSLLDSQRIDQGVATIRNYLRNKKGYYQAEVDVEIKELSDYRAKVTYLVETGERYNINQIYHISRDSSLVADLEEIAKGSILKKTDAIDAFSFNLEKQRIVTEFQHRGYADFNLSNVEIKGDSSDLDKAWDIFMVVIPPAQSATHKQYSIGDINIYTDFHQAQKEADVITEYRYGKYYKHQSKGFIVDPAVIDKKIFLEKSKLYNSENYLKTVNNLFSLETYKFAKLTPRINPRDSSLIDYNIFLTPHDKKWSSEIGLESFYSNINLSVVASNLIGIAASGGIEDRNTFGGSEKFSSSVETGIEFDPNTLTLTTLALGLNNRLQIPVLTKPFNIIRPLGSLGVIKERTYKNLDEIGKSNLNLGFNYLQNLNFYSRFNVTAGYGYEFELNSRNRLVFNQIGISYNTYTFDQRFIDLVLSRNPVLENSFQNNLFTGLLFNDLTHYYQSERGTNRSNIALISRLELSGIEMGALNSLYNLTTGNSSEWNIGGINFEKLAKVEFDLRWYQRAKQKSQLAARLKAGVAVPLEKTSAVAFIKQFSVGGPSSIRAWRPMHLGPGSYVHEGAEFFNPSDTTRFYQRGDIVIESSLEFRFDLIWLVEGALFLDAGNVWTIREEPLRPGSKFGWNFIDNFAVGYGYGVRFDFNYFIIRFDIGFKLRYPSIYGQDGTKYLDSRWAAPTDFGNFNIAVNYPF